MNNNINIISIEGNIGSGKSTVINTLKQYYKENKNVYFLEEPVNEWENIKNSSNKNIIELFYKNQEKYSFSFQMMAYISRLAMLKRAILHCKENNIKLIICERSLQTDKNVFCRMLFHLNKIEDINYSIYLKWFNEFIIEIPTIYFIYIKTNPETAYERVKKRNRKGENIDLEYLKNCDYYHNTWLTTNKDCIVLDGNLSSTNTFNCVNDILTKFSI